MFIECIIKILEEEVMRDRVDKKEGISEKLIKGVSGKDQIDLERMLPYFST